MKKMILMFGISGSGKSTLAKEIFSRDGGVILSTDDLLMDSTNSSYLWNAAMLKPAHELNQKKAEIAALRGISPIIIDNTNLSKWERDPYFEIANKYNYNVEIVEPTTEWKHNVEICSQKNCHSVPKEVIQRQLERKLNV